MPFNPRFERPSGLFQWIPAGILQPFCYCRCLFLCIVVSLKAHRLGMSAAILLFQEPFPLNNCVFKRLNYSKELFAAIQLFSIWNSGFLYFDSCSSQQWCPIKAVFCLEFHGQAKHGNEFLFIWPPKMFKQPPLISWEWIPRASLVIDRELPVHWIEWIW